MEALFKKYFWVLKTLGVAAATGLAASAITTQLGTNFLLDVEAIEADEDEGEDEDEDEDDASASGKKRSKKKGLNFGASPFSAMTEKNDAKARTVGKIMARNVFCPTCVPLVVAGEVPTTSSGPMQAGKIAPGEIKTTLNLRLMATLEAEDPKYSFATIYDGDAKITGLFGTGDALRAQVVVEGVDQGLVHLRHGGQLEYLEIGSIVEVPKSTKKDKKKDKKPKKPSKNAIEGAAEAINCPSDNVCIIQRAFVDSLLANPGQLAKQARVVPSQKDGKTAGYKLYGIRRDSLPKLLKLKNGDMITEVNGQSLTSVDKAMSLYTKLRRASQLEVKVVRKGKTITKEIQIQ